MFCGHFGRASKDLFQFKKSAKNRRVSDTKYSFTQMRRNVTNLQGLERWFLYHTDNVMNRPELYLKTNFIYSSVTDNISDLNVCFSPYQATFMRPIISSIIWSWYGYEEWNLNPLKGNFWLRQITLWIIGARDRSQKSLYRVLHSCVVKRK